LELGAPGAGASSAKPKPCTEANSKTSFLEASRLAEGTCRTVLARLERYYGYDGIHGQLHPAQNPAVWYDESKCCWMVECVFHIFLNRVLMGGPDALVDEGFNSKKSVVANGCD
jgi:hypothetical protein